MAEVVFDHRITYPDNHSITLSDIADTLRAQEKLIPLAIQAIENIFPGLALQPTRIELRYARIGSLDESFFIAILAVYQKDFDRAVPDFVNYITGVRIPDEIRPILSVVFILLVFYGLKACAKKISGKKDDATPVPPTISGDYNTYINLASATLNVPPHQIENAVAAVVTDKRKELVEKASINFVKPAKRGDYGRILVDGAPEISRETVAASPDTASSDDEPGTDTVDFKNAILEIRATDRDKDNAGWAGRLYSGFMSTPRVKVSLYPGIDKEFLASKHQVRVDALVETKTLPDGSVKPLVIHVVRIIS